MISHCLWQIYIRLCSFHFFWHHLTTFTFTHLQDSYHDISRDCVIVFVFVFAGNFFRILYIFCWALIPFDEPKNVEDVKIPASKHSDHSRQNGIGCIDLTFLHCVLSKVISNFLNEQRKTLLCVFKWFLKLPAPKDAWSHWLHLLTFLRSSTVGFRMYPLSAGQVDTKLHWLHLFDFSPLCVFKCILKLPAWEEA